ncbi:MAG TPA: hypothetical protein VH913_17885 [Hyphomicrobiaceae bacterium]|jgi:hypothetical protein
MTIATNVAALLEPTFGRPGPQPMGAVLGLAPIAGPVAGLADPATGRASHIIDIIGLLASLTDNQVDALAPVDRRLLQDQLERVHRMVAGATILNEARPAAASEGGAPRCGKAAFLDELRDGRGRE